MKSKTQVVRRDQGAGLADVAAQDATQGRVEKVGGGVVAHGVGAALAVHLSLDRLADSDAPFDNAAPVDDEPLGDALGVLHGDASLRPDDLAPVAHLAAALGVGRGSRPG